MGTGSVTEPHHTPYLFDPDAQPSTNPVLCEVLSHLPATSAAFGYGSGVFHQPGLYSPGLTKPMLDFILAVPDPVEWHARNLARNRGHYSCIGSLGASTASLAECGGREGAALHQGLSNHNSAPALASSTLNQLTSPPHSCFCPHRSAGRQRGWARASTSTPWSPSATR